jgi:16S rRNA (cytosine967-C5)-methyltransferase
VAARPWRPDRRLTSARAAAYRVVRRVTSDAAWADRAFRAEADRAQLDPRDRAFAQQLAYGTVQRTRTLDHALAAASSRPLNQVDPALLDALRLGAYQVLFLDGVPDHAAVESTPSTTPLLRAPRSSTRTRTGSRGCGGTSSARTRRGS